HKGRQPGALPLSHHLRVNASIRARRKTRRLECPPVGRLLTPAAVAALVVLTVFDVLVCAASLTWQIGTDFRMPYAAGEIARSHGWQHIYDVALQRPAVLGLGHSDLFYPYL